MQQRFNQNFIHKYVKVKQLTLPGPMGVSVFCPGLTSDNSHFHHPAHAQLTQDPVTGHTLLISTMPVAHTQQIGRENAHTSNISQIEQIEADPYFKKKSFLIQHLLSPGSLSRHPHPITSSRSSPWDVQTLSPVRLSSSQSFTFRTDRPLTWDLLWHHAFALNHRGQKKIKKWNLAQYLRFK